MYINFCYPNLTHMARKSHQQGRLVKAKAQCRLVTSQCQWFIHLSIYSIVSFTRLVKAINLVVNTVNSASMAGPGRQQLL